MRKSCKQELSVLVLYLFLYCAFIGIFTARHYVALA